MKRVGTTKDGRAVVSGLLRLYETDGLPLAVIFHCYADKGIVPCWMSFWREARVAGWKATTITTRLADAIADTWGADHRDVVMRILDTCVETGRLS